MRTTNPLLAELRKAKNLDLVEVPTEEAGVGLIREGKARVLAVFQPPKDGADRIVLRFDPKEDGAQIAKAVFESDFKEHIDRRVAAVTGAAGIRPEQLTPIAFEDKPVQVGDSGGASGILVGILPYLLVLFTFTGGVAVASDLVAGEKERSTLETLLIAPVKRTEIVMGKFLALAVVCVVAAISGLLGFILSASVKTPASEVMFKTGLGITPVGTVQIFLILLPLAATFSGVLIAVSSYARNSREAQTYLGLLNLVVLIPAMFSQIIGLTEYGSAVWVPFVPILGAAAGIRLVLLGKATALGVLGPFAVGAVLAGLALWAAIRLFQRESVLLRV